MKSYAHVKPFDVPINKKTHSDIIYDCEFETEEEALICEDIIDSLERFAGANIKEGKTVSLPYIGTLRKSGKRAKIVEMQTDIKIYRQTHTKEEYQDYIRGILEKVQEQYDADDLERMQKIAVKSVAKKTFEKIYKNKGPEEAAAFLNVIYKLKEVKYDQDVEDAYQKLYNEE